MDRRLTRNYHCDENMSFVLDQDSDEQEGIEINHILNNCSRVFKSVTLKEREPIAGGEYGKIYSAVGVNKKNKSIPLAIKVFKKRPDNPNFFLELEYTYYMSYIGIGPTLYDGFHYTDHYNRQSQVLLMEYFQGDCSDGLAYNPNIPFKVNLINQMLRNIHDITLKHGMFYFDVKANNFLYTHKYDNISDEEFVVVKITDFDPNYCFPQPKMTKDTLFAITGILFIMLYFNCCALLLGQAKTAVDIDNLNTIIQKTFEKWKLFPNPFSGELNEIEHVQTYVTKMVKVLNINHEITNLLRNLFTFYCFGKTLPSVTYKDIMDVLTLMPNDNFDEERRVNMIEFYQSFFE